MSWCRRLWFELINRRMQIWQEGDHGFSVPQAVGDNAGGVHLRSLHAAALIKFLTLLGGHHVGWIMESRLVGHRRIYRVARF